MNDMAKVFWSGRSQAVRLPKANRFESSQVHIRREGERVILEPLVSEDDLAWAMRLAGGYSKDAAAAALDRPGPEALPERLSFD